MTTKKAYCDLMAQLMLKHVNGIIDSIPDEPSDTHCDVLRDMATRLEFEKAWFEKKTPHAPISRVELPSETVARQDAERRDWAAAWARLKGLEAATTYKNKSIS